MPRSHVGEMRLPAGPARAARAGIGIYPVTPYYLTPPRQAGLVLGYAGLSESAIRAAIERLATILH